jgi:hypothetical protein
VLSTYVCPFCNSVNLVPTESTQPCAASPRFARPRPRAPSGFIPEIDADVGETTLILARFFEPEQVGLSPVSDLSASESGTGMSRERRRTILLDGKVGSCSDVGERCCRCVCSCCCCDRCTTRARFVLRADASVAPSSRETTPPLGRYSDFPMSAFSSATDDMDDWERRGLQSVLGAEEDAAVVVVGEEMEMEAV